MSEIDDAGVTAMQGPLLRLGPQPGKSLAISGFQQPRKRITKLSILFFSDFDLLFLSGKADNDAQFFHGRVSKHFVKRSYPVKGI